MPRLLLRLCQPSLILRASAAKSCSRMRQMPQLTLRFLVCTSTTPNRPQPEGSSAAHESTGEQDSASAPDKPTSTAESTADEEPSGESTASSSNGEDSSNEADEDEATLRARLLDAALNAVPEHGWTVAALSAGAVACGLSPAAHGVAPGGPIELVRHFSAKCNAQLQEELSAQSEQMEALVLQNRLVLAMQIRLRMLEPYIASWPQALALRTLPSNVAQSLEDAHNLASLLLDACGEGARSPLAPTAVDVHLKRLSLAAVYGAAELYMLTDQSPGFSDTWLFLEREVDALHNLAGASAQLQTLNPAAILQAILQPRK